ncbi:Mbov_0121 family peptidase domain-containing ABC transporter [Mycoplasmopsis primatum]|uniref:Mbov_0121 family peptidase domain-containing ABC transporter n=1 Tax=Mycoplasmopsis primatum TaxID=55604 RepID=UPI0004950ACB|nr:cysteine peptidase family C39 domain-containing protein [Mycoplasmopsis primatum]
MKIKKQEDQKDCGLYVLNSFIQFFHHKEIDINYFKLNCSYGKDGISLLNLKNIASNHGLRINSYTGDFDALLSLDKTNLPLVLLLNRNGIGHYVILTKIKNNKFYILDSEFGALIKMSEQELKNQFANVVIFVEPISFENKKGKFLIENKIKDLISNRGYIYPLLVAALLNLVLSFSSTFFIKIVFDFILPNFLNKALIAIFILFVWLTLIKFINLYFKSYLINKISNRIYLNLNQEYFSKLRNTSINNLSKLNNSEFFKRASFLHYISDYQANFGYTFISEILSLCFSSLLLIWLNYLLFAIVFGITILILFSNLIYQYKIENRYMKSIQISSEKVQIDLDYINSKENFSDYGFTEHLNFLQYNRTIKQKQDEQILFNYNNNNGLLNNSIINNISNIVIFVSTFLIIRNKLTSGDMMMFLTSISFFINPLLSMSNLFASKALMKNYVNQVNFVFNLPKKELFDKGIIIDQIDNIKLENIKFGYEEGNNILNINKCEINSNICIKGDNGSGKSSIAKLIKGDFDNYTGTYEINGINVKHINFEDLRRKIVYIGNNFYIPNTKIIDFITDNNREKLEELNKNIIKYKLLDVLNKVNVNLNIHVNNNAGNLSSGQKQIILLLRLFCQKYKLIILDEAFENIDVDTSLIFRKAIKKYQNDARYIEISHNSNYINKGKVVNFNEVNQNI